MTTQDSRPQAPASNEAAERLRKMWGMGPVRVNLLNEALAAERQAGRDEVATAIRDIERNTRRATVERIGPKLIPLVRIKDQAQLSRILDEEAER